MDIQFVSAGEYRTAADRLCDNGICELPLLQTAWWAGFKAEFGWIPLYCLVDDKPLLILRRKLLPACELWYVPWGFSWGGQSQSDLGASMQSIKNTASKVLATAIRCPRLPRPVCIRIDVPFGRYDYEPDTDPPWYSGIPEGLVDPHVRIQVPTTVLLDLSRPYPEILAGMKKKTRYNIGLAERKGVRVRRAKASEIDVWYDMYLETAHRDGIAIHSREYYRRFLSSAADDGTVTVELLLAEHEGDLLAGIITASSGATAYYMYGASRDVKRNLMPAYLLQGIAIQRLQQQGCRWYDLLGIPHTGDPAHPMHGLFRFKTGFGGRILCRMGIVDIPAAGARYRFFRALETARQGYHHWRKSRS